MALLKLNLAPDQAAYSATDGSTVVSTQLDGGASRYRKDIENAAAIINVQWSIGPVDFRYLKGFFNLATDKGAKGFLLDLYLDSEELTEHECKFVPGSFRLASQRGQQFVCTAQVEAIPVRLTEEEETAETDWVALYGEYGADFETLFPPDEDNIDQLITFDIPDAMGINPADRENIIWWGGSTPAIVNNDEVVDKVDPARVSAAKYVGNNCISFNGSTHKLKVPYSSSFALGLDDFIIEGKIKTISVDAGIINQWNGAAAAWSSWITGGKLNLAASLEGTSTKQVTSKTLVNDGIWHKYRQARFGKYGAVYLDDKIDTDSPNMPDGPIYDDGGPIYIGARVSGSTGYFNGLMSHVKISKPADNNISVVILLGQSNAVGSSQVSAPDDYINEQEHSFSYIINGGANAESVPLVSISTVWGAEVSFGKQLTENGYRRVLFVKVATVGTNQAVDWSKGGTMYNSFISTLSSALLSITSLGYTPKIETVLWMQGEADAQVESWANNYAANHLQMRQDFISDTALNGTEQWVVARIPDSSSYTYKDVVRAQQDSIGAFDTDDLSVRADNVHFDADGLVALGERFYENTSKVNYNTEYITLAEYTFSEGDNSVYAFSRTADDLKAELLNNPLRVVDDDAIPHNLNNGFSFGFLTNGSSAVIDTGIVPTDNTVIEYRARHFANSTTSRTGCRGDGVSAPQPFYFVGASSSDTNYRWFCGSSNIDTGVAIDGEFHTFRLEGRTLYIDENPVGTGTSISSLADGFTIGGVNYNGSYGDYALMEVAACSISELGTQVYNYKSDFPKIQGVDSLIDALGNPLTNLGNYHHNGAESKVKHTDFEVVDSIVVSGTGNRDGQYDYYGVTNSKGEWRDSSNNKIRWDGSNWYFYDPTDAPLAYHSTDTGTFPPLTGWDTGPQLPTLYYDCLYVENGEFKEVSYADYLADYPSTPDYLAWVQKERLSNGVEVVREVTLYSQQFTPTLYEISQNERWAGKYV